MRKEVDIQVVMEAIDEGLTLDFGYDITDEAARPTDERSFAASVILGVALGDSIINTQRTLQEVVSESLTDLELDEASNLRGLFVGAMVALRLHQSGEIDV